VNRQEIDEMMSHLPSQQPVETTTQKWVIGMWFVMFLILCIYAPDIRYQPTEEKTHGNSQENTNQEGCRKGTSQGTREESTREGLKSARGGLQT
jgi:hypothetical protein